MLRGLDTSGGNGDDVSMIIKVAGRTDPEADVTVYLRESVSSAERERQAVVRTEMERLENAGVLDGVTFASWNDVRAGERFDEFVDAVGAGALEPFFDEKADGSAIEVPAVCIAVRADDELTGLYPRRKDGAEQTVGDCVRALCTGDRVENVSD